ncbi:hypothetical protein JBKA6_1038 [Ichthyobacterium seriolicida]|uniref:Uncharacterized protein n=1 Tax=Ichthyobacterium seriolicida TaxID=242600 RepID=A0A1J1EAT5_9FLAO|nr:hypothetical protein JBKA6_1038 [Ichthyobacterium seriolicida]
MSLFFLSLSLGYEIKKSYIFTVYLGGGFVQNKIIHKKIIEDE